MRLSFRHDCGQLNSLGHLPGVETAERVSLSAVPFGRQRSLVPTVAPAKVRVVTLTSAMQFLTQVRCGVRGGQQTLT